MGYRTLLIYNPTAGPWDMTRTLKRLAADLEQDAGWSVEFVQTEHPGDTHWYAQRAVRNSLDIVLVAGGDGTINEAVNGLAGADTMMGIVPVGTGNVLAHQLQMPILSFNVPFQVPEVTEALLAGRVQRVDVGNIGGRRFLCWGGAGLDAEITTRLEPRPRYAKHLGSIPYIIAAFSVASQFRGFRARISVGDRRFSTRALLILASNIRLYAAFFSIARHAKMDDGLLDIFIFKGLGFAYAFRHLLHIFSGRYLRDPGVIHILTRQMQIETHPAVAVHLDGDPLGETPAVIKLEPGNLRLLVPPQAPDDLFTKSPEARL